MPGFEWFGDEERKQVQDVLDTGVLFRYGFDGARNGHWKTRTFEEKLAEYLQTNHCHLCSSGTAALNVAMAACGVGAGDEVIVPPFTFVATFEAVLAAGAIPIFAEIDETLGLSPTAVEKCLSPRTKCIIAVHMCGAMAQIDELKSLCDRKGLILIEDTCQSIGGTFNGKALGTFGHAGCFSFDPVKTITCGEAGAVVTNDPKRYDLMHAYADHGHDHIGNDRGAEGHPILGYNYRVSELNAAVGVAQLAKLDAILEKQKEAKTAIKKALSDIDHITWRRLPDEAGDSATFLSFLLPNENAARKATEQLSAAGVDGCFYYFENNWHYLRMWQHLKNMATAATPPLRTYENRPDYAAVQVPQSDDIIARNISMQIKLSWTPAEIEKRIEQMHDVLLNI